MGEIIKDLPVFYAGSLFLGLGIDPHAFVFTNTIKETAGGVIKRHIEH